MNDQPDPSPRPEPRVLRTSASALLSRIRVFVTARPARVSPDLHLPPVWARSIGAPALPLTSLVLLLLVTLPALQLLRLPRPRAVGLEQLLSEVSLLQSFPPTPERPVPALWRERLGPVQAEALWRRQRGPWWQFWGDHAEAAPLLAFTASTIPGGRSATLPANGLRVGDLIVVAADPLSRQLLRDRLLPQQRLSRGLRRRCLERLRQTQAVLWNDGGMGVITGPVAPLLQRLSQGCLSFSLADAGLVWEGEAGDGAAVLSSRGPTRQAAPSPQPPLPADRLLEIEGGATDLLLQGLLSRPLIRDPLVSRYGLDAPRLALLRRTPFQLLLRPLPQGPFQASLELRLPVGHRRTDWNAQLTQLSRALVQQGLTPSGATPHQGPAEAAVPPQPPTGALAVPPPAAVSGPPAQASSTPPSAPFPAPVAGAGTDRPAEEQEAGAAGATWRRSDGAIVGGWRWISAGAGEPQLLLFLGPVPPQPWLPARGLSRRQPGPGILRLRSRPAALMALGLLPPDVPALVGRSEQLWMLAEPPTGSDPRGALSLLSGGLRVSR
ncbi:MAG: hypothetical protein ACKO0M_16665 [Cyanobium sp.]